ncbi:YveK family protein [Mycolicibacterium arenosum]|uniref:Capsular polysaccharide biosynthesis protein n=1 Tax=Mycolicibacterium arenosum TaxID=2952157 RepID=A0ABT1M4S2_9MYCO|nr:hypothetical protein [Mycolicibacterium sp. CAU 1645]MCP9273802.1 hypothetical protein [Mycolicibacterium sp. CAU 1645]
MRVPVGAPKLRDYALIAARWSIVLAIATVLSGVVGWVSWLTMTPTYQSHTRVMVTSPGAATSFDAFYGQLNSVSRILTYQTLARSTQVTSPTIEQLGLTDSTGALAGRIIVPPTSSPVFDVIVTGSDPTQTQEVAQAVTVNLVALTRQMATVDGGGAELMQIDQASPPKRVGSMWSTILQGAALGLGLSVVLVIGYVLVRGRVLGRGQLDRIVAEPIAPTPA